MFDPVQTSLPSAVKAAQTLMLLFQPSPRIAVDGVWGPLSASKFASLGSEAKGLVSALFSSRGHQIPAVVEGPKPDTDVWISEGELRRAIRDAVARKGEFAVTGLSSEEYLLWIARLESIQKVVDGVRWFKANSVSPNGLYKGVFQFGAPAYSDVKASNRIPDLPPFVVAATTPAIAAEMAVIYSQLLIGYLRRGDPRTNVRGFSGPVTREILYGAHNQGAIGLLKGAKNALVDKGQSTVATSIIRTAVSQVV